jgi:hypothetical protein
MTKDERLQKAIRKVNSAILHTKALAEDGEDVDFIVGDLQKALDRLYALNYEQHHEGHKLVQMELFA